MSEPEKVFAKMYRQLFIWNYSWSPRVSLLLREGGAFVVTEVRGSHFDPAQQARR